MRREKYFIVLTSATFFFAISFFSIAFAKEFRYDSHDKRDPFALAARATKVLDNGGSVANLKLEGVIMDPHGRSLALVNGEMVGEGDRIGGVVLVKKVIKDRVEFENNGQVFTIPIVKKE